MNNKKYTTNFRIVAPKLFGKDLFCNIAKETDKAYLLVDVVQDTDKYTERGIDECEGLMLSMRWMAKSQITLKVEEKNAWQFEYDGYYNGMMCGQQSHRRQ